MLAPQYRKLNRMKKRLLGLMFQLGLHFNAARTRRPGARAIEQRLLTPFFVRLTLWIRGSPRSAVPTQEALGPESERLLGNSRYARITRRSPCSVALTPEALGREWERLLGNSRYARVMRTDATTAYGEITGLCPLRGTGDLAACHRLMAYDRGLIEPLDAHFVVLASQAEPGRTSCEIAIRLRSHAADDLVPAHSIMRSAL